MTTQWIHCIELRNLALTARQRAREDASPDPAAWTPDSVVAVLAAVVSAEAFINEFAALVRFDLEHMKERAVVVPPPVRAFSSCFKIKDDGIRAKYKKAKEALSGAPFDESASPFLEFNTLVELRNALVHLKLVQHGTDPAEEEPECIADLVRLGVLEAPRVNGAASWFNRIQTVKVADWACVTLRAIIVAILDLIPPDYRNWFVGAVRAQLASGQ